MAEAAATRHALVGNTFGLVGDRTFRALATAAAVLVLLTMGAVILALLWGSIPLLERFGLAFFVSDTWNPVTDDFGALPSIYGTLVSSLIALVLGVPVSFGIAFYLTFVAPDWLRRPVGIALELLAAVPSIIYGMWGLFVFAPLFSSTIQQRANDWFTDLPVLQTLLTGPPLGIGMLTAGIILAIMVIPFVSSVMRDVFETVPKVLLEAAYGVGCTTWEVVRSIVIPYTRVSVIGAIMLGLGRALGETMAVTFVIGNSHNINASLFMPGTTIASSVANEFNEAVGDIYTSALIALGLTLFVITFIVLALARWLLSRVRHHGSL